MLGEWIAAKQLMQLHLSGYNQAIRKEDENIPASFTCIFKLRTARHNKLHSLMSNGPTSVGYITTMIFFLYVDATQVRLTQATRHVDYRLLAAMGAYDAPFLLIDLCQPSKPLCFKFSSKHNQLQVQETYWSKVEKVKLRMETLLWSVTSCKR